MVKCADCGFLAYRDSLKWEFTETPDIVRKTGGKPFLIYGGGLPIIPPVCFINKYDLWAESGDINHASPETIKCTVQKDRECDSLAEYQQGFTPKEHREMLDRKWMLNYQAAREKEDKQWRDDQRRRDLEWREKQEKSAENRHRWDLIIVGIVATLVLSFSAIAAALIERKIWFP